jgi:agmatinase
MIKFPTTGRLVDLGDLRIYPLEIAKTCATLRAMMSGIIQRGAFPVMLGGDHYITYPLLQGLKEGVSSRGGKKIGYIQLASQLDLAEQDMVWGKDWHGATVKRILDAGVVDPQNIAWIGIHGYVPAGEWKLAHSRGATVITSYALREQGIAETVQQVARSVCQGCDSIYLSLDIGVVDGGQIPGRGDITVGALTPTELLEVVRALSRLNLGALDVVEVAPTWDPLERTQRLAAEAIIELIAPKVFVG